MADRDDTLWFLDFDGVLCDSLPECYTVSRTAYWTLFLGMPEPPASRAEEAEFARMRPLIRRGADYLLLHLAMREGLRLTSQGDFDALAAREAERDGLFHELFYRARSELLRQAPERWFALNPLYPGIREILLRNRANRAVLILSTKEAPFILEILRHHGVEWEADRILCSGKEPKLRFVDRILSERGAGRAVFVDDQIDHFQGVSDHPVRRVLADWGYVRPEWIESGTVETISRTGFPALLPA
jgi:phosphoglycolate phosphatase-like HAD superfamily hydrolase